MKINVSKLKQEVLRLNKLEDDYESVYLNYYKTIKDVNNEWKNIRAKRLMENIAIEKKQMNMVYNNLKDMNKLYSYICDKYSFANKIMMNSEEEKSIIIMIDGCINHLERIKRLCSTIDIKNMNDTELSILETTKNKINQEYKEMLMLKTKLRDIFLKVRNIENDIKGIISEFSLDIISETDISGCIEG